eukprot:GFUD01050759.1.p1 GENE.GFUD01050759.1~~GFUD01050759.1.p1  ORF type:complete len:228 (+),score=24.58 GFUD01050759.1:2-685(+)
MKLLKLSLLLLPFLCYSEGKKGTRSCITKGGPQPNRPCIFPFRYGGVTYNSCITAGRKQPWCSTATYTNGTHIGGLGQYGLCPSSCPGVKPTTEICVTEGGPQPNRPCIFPFRYGGVTYNSCTTADLGQPWCSTATYTNGSHISGLGQYGLCTTTCPGGKQNTESCVTKGGPQPNKPCIFPFHHGGVTYYSCTTAGLEQPWCSTATYTNGSHIRGLGQYGLCPTTCL